MNNHLMNLYKTVCAGLIALLILPSLSYAQLNPLKRARNRVNQKANQRANQEIDKQVDKVFDSIFGTKNNQSPKDTTKNPSANNDGDRNINININMNGGAPVDVEPLPPSDFIGSFTMTYVEYKNGKKKSTMDMDYHIDTWETAMVMNNDDNDSDNGTMIFSRKDRSMTVLSHEEKTAMKMRIPAYDIQVVEDSIKANASDARVKATGRTKMIEGKRCKEYRFDDIEEGKYMLAWFSEDSFDFMTAGFGPFMSMQSRNSKSSNPYANLYGIKGFMLEAHTYDTKGELENDIYFKNFKEGSVDKSVFSTAGYQIMDMSGFNFGNN